MLPCSKDMETGNVLASLIFGNLTLNLQSEKRLGHQRKLDRVTLFSLFLDLIVWIAIRQSLSLTNTAKCSIVSGSKNSSVYIVLVVSPRTTHLH